MKVLWLHGLESGPFGSKYKALVAAGYDVIAPDLRGKNLAERVVVAGALMEEHVPFVVGSSYGGITAVLAAKACSNPLPGMVLCAPALTFTEAPMRPLEELAPPCRMTIVHGRNDDVIPVEVSRKYADMHGVPLIEVGDGHRLSESGSKIVEALRAIVMEATRAFA
jgi:pimeloyl-ACP methyl ester carboxylesterase